MANGIEIVDNERTIETVNANVDLKKVLKDEKFMEETLVVYLSPSNNDNDAPYAHLNVNGMNQIVPRGQNVPIKRKYVEILARMKETRYNQSTPNPSEPDRMQMHARHALVFPFSVVTDPNPKGAAWLQHIMNEAV